MATAANLLFTDPILDTIRMGIPIQLPYGSFLWQLDLLEWREGMCWYCNLLMIIPINPTTPITWYFCLALKPSTVQSPWSRFLRIKHYPKEHQSSTWNSWMPLQVKNPWIYGPLHVQDIQRAAPMGPWKIPWIPLKVHRLYRIIGGEWRNLTQNEFEVAFVNHLGCLVMSKKQSGRVALYEVTSKWVVGLGALSALYEAGKQISVWDAWDDALESFEDYFAA